MTTWPTLAKRHGLPSLVRDLPGLAVVTVRDLTTAHMSVPAGTQATIEHASAWTKIRIKAKPCQCCGIAAKILVDAGCIRIAEAADTPS